jgi:hypothetical protein
MNTREHDGRTLYRMWSRGLIVPAWEDLPDFRRERWRVIAAAMRAMFAMRDGVRESA